MGLSSVGIVLNLVDLAGDIVVPNWRGYQCFSQKDKSPVSRTASVLQVEEASVFTVINRYYQYICPYEMLC